MSEKPTHELLTELQHRREAEAGTCKSCNGTGGEYNLCSDCGGSGIEFVYGGHGNVLEVPCSTCAASPSSPASGVRVKPTHRHVKRGSEYVLIGYGKMQAEGWITLDVYLPDREHQSVDMREVAIYRSVDDGSLWVRPREEFEDGRFVVLSALGEHP